MGGDPLLLVHGFTGAKEDFADWMEPLADAGWHVVAPDNRGHGFSDHPGDESAYSLDAFADDLEALVSHLGWTSFALLGHSMGGMVAQRLAVRMADRLTALVLMDTTHRGLSAMPSDQVAAAQHVVRTHGMEALVRLLEAGAGPPRPQAHERVVAARPGFAEFGRMKMHNASPAMYAAMSAELTSFEDGLDALRALSAPTLVIVGAQDEPFLKASQRMAEAIQTAQLVVVPEAAHSPQFENPDAWWSAVSGFLASTRATAKR